MKHSIDSAIRAPWHYAETPELCQLKASTERICSSKLNVAAGLAWDIYQSPAYFYAETSVDPSVDEHGYVHAPDLVSSFKLAGRKRAGRAPVPDYYLNVRDDTHEVLGVVKRRYRVIQNALAPELLDRIVEGGQGSYEVAGALHRGAQVWWLASLDQSVVVAGEINELIEMFVLLTNSHDGSTSINLALLPYRAMSVTTLAWRLPGCQRILKAKHGNSADQLSLEADELLHHAAGYQRKLVRVADEMLHTPINADELNDFLGAVLPTPSALICNGRTVNRRGITMANTTKALIEQVYGCHPTQRHIEGTLWGLVQACQFVSDHLSISRNTDDCTGDENRFKRISSGQNLGAVAFAHALALLDRPLTVDGKQ